MKAKYPSRLVAIAAVVVCQLVAAPLAAQDATPTERAFELLGLEGGGLTEDPARIAEGLSLLQAAAESGDGVAQNTLGMVYTNGLYGIEVDVDRALELYAAAMDSDVVGNIAALNWALTSYSVGNTEAAVERLEALYALDWELAPAAAATLANAYAFGQGAMEDLSRAGELYEVAVEWNPNDSQAHYMLGRGYETGFFGSGVQESRAYTHYLAAAELGDPRAAWKVGMAHLEGLPDFDGGSEQAYRWVRQSAEAGWIDGMISTAVMLATGDGTGQDVNEAAYWYTEAALQGSAHAMRGLGAMLYNGELGERDPLLGLALLELGAQGGDEFAGVILDSINEQTRGVDRGEIERAKAEWRQRLENR
ncbi:MAG: tetratricopeptide repeat protein [Gammaproteobacteria bacterium]|nr:tetratricopeptide repeat protein [Gammaproteobacteria bacterium]